MMCTPSFNSYCVQIGFCIADPGTLGGCVAPRSGEAGPLIEAKCAASVSGPGGFTGLRYSHSLSILTLHRDKEGI